MRILIQFWVIYFRERKQVFVKNKKKQKKKNKQKKQQKKTKNKTKKNKKQRKNVSYDKLFKFPKLYLDCFCMPRLICINIFLGLFTIFTFWEKKTWILILHKSSYEFD